MSADLHTDCRFCGNPLSATRWCASCEEQDPPETISTLTLDDCRKLYSNPFGTEVHGDPMLKRRAA